MLVSKGRSIILLDQMIWCLEKIAKTQRKNNTTQDRKYHTRGPEFTTLLFHDGENISLRPIPIPYHI